MEDTGEIKPPESTKGIIFTRRGTQAVWYAKVDKLDLN